MPAKSEKQRKMFAIAAHEPGQLYKKNKGVMSMQHEKLREFSKKPGKSKKKKLKEAAGWKFGVSLGTRG